MCKNLIVSTVDEGEDVLPSLPRDHLALEPRVCVGGGGEGFGGGQDLDWNSSSNTFPSCCVTLKRLLKI